jgi:hypothetical protein
MDNKLTEEELAVLRGMRDSAEWKLLVKLSQSVKGDFIQAGYSPSINRANGERMCDDTDRFLALGSAQGIDRFMTTVSNLVHADDKY